MSTSAKYVVGVGAANIDIHCKSKKPLIMRDSNPGFMHTSVGGVTRNILENLARLGVDARLVAAVGADVFGQKIISDSRAAGIDMSNVLVAKDRASSTYVSVLDDTGDMFVALSDMHITSELTREYLDNKRELLQGASAIICDPCIPPQLMKYLLFGVGAGIPIFVDTVSTSYAATIADIAGGFHTIKPNRMELEVLAKMRVESDEELETACTKLLEKGTQRVIVSLGKDGCYYSDRDGVRKKAALAPIETMVNATGGGDAFMAAVIYSFLRGMTIEQTLDNALAAGVIAIMSDETISPQMSESSINKVIMERKQ